MKAKTKFKKMKYVDDYLMKKETVIIIRKVIYKDKKGNKYQGWRWVFDGKYVLEDMPFELFENIKFDEVLK